MNSVPATIARIVAGSRFRPWRRLATKIGGHSTSAIASPAESRGGPPSRRSSTYMNPPAAPEQSHAIRLNENVCENGSTCTRYGTPIRYANGNVCGSNGSRAISS